MRLSVLTYAPVGRQRGEHCRKSRRLAALSLVASLMISASAHADNSGYTGYEEYYYTPREYVVPSPYTYDPVNRRNPFTPEPVWRDMFPSIHERAIVEERTFGVPGAADHERRYWRSWGRRMRGK